jgi:hypothetical protein
MSEPVLRQPHRPVVVAERHRAVGARRAVNRVSRDTVARGLRTGRGTSAAARAGGVGPRRRQTPTGCIDVCGSIRDSRGNLLQRTGICRPRCRSVPKRDTLDRLQRVPIPADNRHRSHLVGINTLRPHLDPSPPLHRRRQQQLAEAVLHRGPRLRGRSTAGHLPVSVPQLQAQPHPITVAVERRLAGLLHGVPYRRDQRVCPVDAKLGRARAGGGGCGRRRRVTVALRFGGPATLRVGFWALDRAWRPPKTYLTVAPRRPSRRHPVAVYRLGGRPPPGRRVASATSHSVVLTISLKSALLIV